MASAQSIVLIKVKIIDEEQKDKGNQTNDLELLSVPVGFRYGILNKSNTPQTIHLNARNYQTHTNVVTDGFYTRLRMIAQKITVGN